MLPLLYLDDHLVAVNKPPGLLVHRTGLDAGETQFALQIVRDQLGRPVWPVHRLDKGTSGVLLFALDAATASAIGQSFESGEHMNKHYRAVVRGWPAPDGTIDHPLRRMPDDMRHQRQEWQPALTRYTCLHLLELPVPYGAFSHTRCALVDLYPQTGRRHQLRRHLKHIAHPIIGDATHGKGPLNRAIAQLLGVQRLWLHAQSLQIRHPLSGLTLTIEAPPDPSWDHWMAFALASTASPQAKP